MPSGIITTMKLDPFYQQFLRAQFHNADIVFRFPPRHDLLMRLECFLTKTPLNYKRQDYGENTFRIELPYMEHKDVMYYNYLSENSQALFAQRVKDFYRMIVHELFADYRRKGFFKTEIVYLIIEDFSFTTSDYDRILKDFNRFVACEKSRRFTQRQKDNKKTSVKHTYSQHS